MESANAKNNRCDDKHEKSVEQVKNAMLKSEDIATMSTVFKVLGEPSRMRIILALMECEMCVYHIAEVVDGQQSAVSHQLRILKDNKIIKSRREGKNILYSIADEHVANIIEMSKKHLYC